MKNIRNTSPARRGWRGSLPLLKRLKAAKWFRDAGQSIGLFIAPELEDIDQIMKAADIDALDNVAAIQEFVQRNAD